ncbi:NAD-glutamate dehydrogenase [Vallicoccus soli]|uniref:NAD-glutamate dehydrogenase n=1 Tax=Vallicoccus soli TaxID=2339232 RepID=A0A3A3Z1S7_9ACTN|nr:NAD-glutamate dehydrogenase [Vallicoccus soli]RJK95428.1 NAD-glutamate dehydrogenase [Vallicoccus soli]
MSAQAGVEAAGTGPGQGASPRVDEALVRRYWQHVPEEDVAARSADALHEAVRAHLRLARRRPPRTPLVAVRDPEGEPDAATSVVEVVVDDMPFLVDSVTAELTRQDRGIQLVVHPTLRVRRDEDGALVGVEPADGGGQVESWMHVEVDRLGGQDDRDEVVAGLLRVLGDVRRSVEDWGPMQAAAERTADELAAHPPAGLPADEVEEARALLRWLADGHFTFLGYREYRLTGPAGGESIGPVPGTGLGLLRTDEGAPRELASLPPEVRRRALEPRLLVITKANSRSTVRRRAYLDYIGVKAFDAEGRVVGERRFLGLFAVAAYQESVQRIPVLRRTTREVLARAGFAPESHSGKDLLQVLETYPRDELFQVSVDDLSRVARAVTQLQERRRLRLFLRRDDYGRFMSCLVYLPRDRYTTRVRQRMERILREAFRGASVDFTARITESVLARLHFVVRTEPGVAVAEVDPGELERRLVEATRSWSDDLADALTAQVGRGEAARLLREYPDAFPEAYKEDFAPALAVPDLLRTAALEREGLAMSLYEPRGAGPGELRFKVYRDGPVSLSAVLPVLRDMGVEVVDERPYEIQRGDGRLSFIYDFGLRAAGPLPRAREGRGGQGLRETFQEAFAAVWNGEAESDGLNALVLAAGLGWRQVAVLRAYARYLRQTGWTYSPRYVEEVVSANPGIARRLVALFEAQFDPALVRSGPDGELAEALAEEVEGALEAVESLDHDRILRGMLRAVRATTRTNAFQTMDPGSGAGPRHKPYVSLKLDPQRLPELPRPRPEREVWVYSPRVEGVHLRFGAVARGGLRWSDRREDFRTEVLGLVKAQAVKNAVIVPVGAKGGFVAKRLPDPSVDREAWLAEGVASYRTFISGLLDITDDLDQERVVPPRDVVRRDGDDPYLVVAADKGTATFSDIANGVSAEYGFWLGDAFASGGSVGYDHKAMGITARGAWESVKRHFRELGVDTQAEDFTVVGVGDMSGDVFGNGMLLSPHIRLVAAFDHRHVFLDPDPDPAASYAERRRLFELPRSSWADYDPALISPGGGVHPRTAKSVPVAPQVRRALGMDGSTLSVTPQQLISAVLRAPVDLFWNGGIGTYVKASTEAHADVGDKANDAIRVDGSALRCRVVGEGGNLGLTQRGRIEAARSGVRLNTDAIDNSAGVDCSDHEVNIKVLLDRLVRDGALERDERDALLLAMTDEVGAHVLRDNYEQNVLLGVGRGLAPSMASVHKRFLRDLEERGVLDRALEHLPTGRELDARAASGGGLTSPELSVVAAYSKTTLKTTLLEGPLPDEPWFQRELLRYFPAPLTARFGDRLAQHPLRRQIVTTCVVNDLVNHAGTTYVFRAAEETGATADDVVRAYTVAREVFGLRGLWADVEALDGQVPAASQDRVHKESRRLLDRVGRWLLQARSSGIDVAAEVERFTPVAQLLPLVPELLQGDEREVMLQGVASLREDGLPEALALRTASLLNGFALLDAVEIARASGQRAEEVARLHFAVSEAFDVDRLLVRITGLPRGDRWQALARAALRYDLYAALAALTTDVLATTGPGSPAERIAAWREANAARLARATGTLEEIAAEGQSDLATLSVALRTLRAVLRG